MPDSSLISSPMLPIIRQLFDALHAEEILYCHWKNNPDHIRASFTGESDVDVLFDIKQKEKIEAVLRAHGFKRFDIVRERYYEDIEDFITLDFTTGKLIHLHTHYRLTMGPLFSKNYQLDIEEMVLARRVFIEETGVYGSTAAIQLLILYLNESLKFRTRDVVKVKLSNKIKYADKVLREYQWLKEKLNEQEWKQLIADVFVDPQEVIQLTDKPFNKSVLLKFRSVVKKQFSDKRIFYSAVWMRWKNEFIINYRKVRSLVTEPVVNRRINPRGGVVVAVIGADGSGKSTVTKDIRATFEKKLDVCRIYFGRGDGRISLSRRLLRKLKGIVKPEKKKKNKSGDVKEAVAVKSKIAYKEPKKGFVASVYKIIEALLVANEKRINLKRMNAARSKGMLVICDRFPQNQIKGYNDGPLLYHLVNSSNPFFKILARWEKMIYERAEKNPPDLLIKLVADAAIVEQRKPGETLMEKLEAKIEGIKALRVDGAMLTIDAAQPLQEVLYQVRKEIWSKL